jgi:hypothetical protein
MNGASAVPVWFRIVAVLALLWNLYGVYHYLGSVGVLSSAAGEGMGPMPSWVVGAFAISVFAGALGSLGLLLLKRWATWLLVISFIAVLAQDLWVFALRPGGAPDKVLPLVITLVAALLVWLAMTGAKRGWLR